MSLNGSLEMQEVIVNSVGMHLDIKRFTSIGKTLSWDINGVVDTIQITLGQKDLSIIMAIYTDNIGEGQILDLFPVSIVSRSQSLQVDETVKNLEAFFCEPKQKYITIKYNFEGLHLMLFFDSGELLSSPIRDLNNGLCKLEISDINASVITFTDNSVEGKLAVDSLIIEEIGPCANVYDKGILHSPFDDNKNNNCHVTINKPPIVDVSFHKNKTGDNSTDIIVGRLSLSLSVPFCEKLSMFILECLPKENIETGIVNPGYVSDQINEVDHQISLTSLTIALRINRPEFIFIVETTSNKKRYFITKTEILSDYSRHGNRINFVVSLSGLHSLFYDLGINSSLEPYVILKQCDVEFSKCFTEEKGEKITVGISSLNVHLCDRVVQSLNDILNDIIEHFKVPEVEIIPVKKSKSFEPEDLWEPKKLNQAIFKPDEDFQGNRNMSVVIHQVFLMQKTEVVVILELDQSPVLILKSTFEMTMYDWSSLLNCTCNFTIQSNYYNENLQCWEPFIDPVVVDENDYKPWEIFVKIFQDKSYPILNNVENKGKKHERKRKRSESRTSSNDEEESGNEMVYLEPSNTVNNRQNRRVKTSLSTFLEDSDSENEDCTVEKLAAAISDLFTGYVFLLNK